MFHRVAGYSKHLKEEEIKFEKLEKSLLRQSLRDSITGVTNDKMFVFANFFLMLTNYIRPGEHDFVNVEPIFMTNLSEAPLISFIYKLEHLKNFNTEKPEIERVTRAHIPV